MPNSAGMASMVMLVVEFVVVVDKGDDPDNECNKKSVRDVR